MTLEPDFQDRWTQLNDQVSRLEERNFELCNQLGQVSTGSTSNPVLVHLAFSTYPEHRFGGLLSQLQGMRIKTPPPQNDTNFIFFNPRPIQSVPVSHCMLKASFDCLVLVCLQGNRVDAVFNEELSNLTTIREKAEQLHHFTLSQYFNGLYFASLLGHSH